MNEFSEVLASLVEQKNASIAQLARFCSIDRSTMYKIVSGKRKLKDKRYLEKISKFLQLTQEEYWNLVHAYEITALGKETFERRKKIREFLKSFCYDNEFIPTIEIPKNESFDKSDSYELLLTKYDVETRILSMLYQEILEEKPKIQMVLQPLDTHLLRTMRRILSLRPDFEIEHMYCYEKDAVNDVKNSFYNLTIFKNVVHFYLGNYRYSTYSIFSSVDSYSVYSMSYPIIFINSNSVLYANAAMDRGFVLNGEEAVSMMSKNFNAHRYYYPRRVHSYPFNRKELDKYMSTKTAEEKEYLYQMTPCLTQYVPLDMARRWIHYPYEMQDELLQAYEKHVKILSENSKNHMRTIIYSIEGVEHFLKTGILDDYPKFLYTPPAMADRIYLVKKLLQDPNFEENRVLKSSISAVENGINMLTSKSNGWIFINKPNDDYLYLEIDNPGILQSFYDYFENLPDDYFFTVEEAKERIRELIKKYENNEDPR